MKHDLRVAILRAGSPYQLDGVNVFIYQLSEALTQLGHKVTIIGGFGASDHKKMSEHFGAETRPNVIVLSNKDLKGAPEKMLAWLSKGFKTIIDFSPHIVIANGVLPIPPVGNRILEIIDLPTTFLPRTYMKLQSTFFNQVVTPTEELKKELLRSLKFPPEKCSVIPLPIETRRYSSTPLDEREHAVLYVDSRERRNLETALEAFSLLRKKDQKVKMYLVGLRREVNDLNRDDDIIWLGTLTRSSLRELYSRVKLLIFPSSYEGFGYPVLEAFASGTPVVGSTAVSRNLLVDGYNGFRLNPHNSHQFAARAFTLLTDVERWKKMSENALTTASHHDSLKIAQRYIKLCGCIRYEN